MNKHRVVKLVRKDGWEKILPTCECASPSSFEEIEDSKFTLVTSTDHIMETSTASHWQRRYYVREPAMDTSAYIVYKEQ